MLDRRMPLKVASPPARFRLGPVQYRPGITSDRFSTGRAPIRHRASSGALAGVRFAVDQGHRIICTLSVCQPLARSALGQRKRYMVLSSAMLGDK